MERRKFLIGTGALAAGGAAALGSGAFSRVESHRDVSIAVANDENAYLGFKRMDTPHSKNYFDYDDEGHAEIQIAGHDDFNNNGPAETGSGVNSNSRTWFDGLFRLCNQGKADITEICLDGSNLDISNRANDALDVYVYASYNSDLPPSSDDPPDHWNTRWQIVQNSDGQEACINAETNTTTNADTKSDLNNRDQLLSLGKCTSVGLLMDTRGDPPVDASGADGTRLVWGEVGISAVAPGAGEES